MSFNRPLKFLAALLAAVSVASLLTVAVTKKSYSESYPAVVCPPTLAGLGSQISLSSKKTPFQRLQNRTTKTAPVKFLRLPVLKDSLVISSEGSTPVAWQSRSGSWAGGALCSGPQVSQWFSGGSADITTKGKLIVINSGLSDAVVEIQAFTENGKQPLKPINVYSKSYLTIPIDSLAPGDKTLVVHVLPRSGRINAFMIDEQGKGLRALGGDFVNPASTASKNVVIAAIPNQQSKKGNKTTTSTQDLRPPFDAGQVAPLPPNTSTMHFLRHVAFFPSKAYQPGLHFLGVFFVGSGTSAQKGASPPYPYLLLLVCSGPYPPQPPCTSYATFSLSFPSQNCCLHPNPPIFSIGP